MTKPSKSTHTPQILKKRVNQYLDQQVSELPDSVASELQIARQRALLVARQHSQASSKANTMATNSWRARLDAFKLADVLKPKLLTPVALAVCLAITVNYLQLSLPQTSPHYTATANVQPLPREILAVEVLEEDLALLQELEFATWLSQQTGLEETL
ncbi:DUF3619 family protein [Thalassotalea euphylliae]|uniref:DUF3619 family protein n=1 Tax=Thalassotalea euphylliae TaxID=1655234 RepID=A0A3E0TNT2_9GAMM|nr:DUF3619 family protein [Thalassotalea euphylliae]REL25742.1 DUF3619 family protein [Thalassotalea euphylliae]